MEPLHQIDSLLPGRPKIGPEQRQKQAQERRELEKQEGYQKLIDLCAIAEPEAAQRLAAANSHWGYKIINGWVHNQTEDVE
ncbi:hypothetical protein PN466_16790 [Roseofilum reptotaenium CS-1145]|uniref:Uncharacterized protein n=1 Tax=Roseofilum reptotaenium AO1-A TaxID=1925591 RepID=A0A1L9QWG4_9CYAN|nr:hypothetical protein [Roseofilum reptotaenium]MDB9518605.1 hypothetical protein [Roseofilum reptotaenium CS-1145]OJJ27003.1 hypothetical protein BI308_02800 [Roseofilum reptotaenium AO1-A]